MADNKSCEVIGGGRRRGKTTELIKRASKDQLYILCPNKNMAKIIFGQAKGMDLDIPYPITVDDLPLNSPYINRILIYEVEMVLQQLIGKRVAGMSTSYELKEMPVIGGKEPKRPKPPKSTTSKSVGKLTVDIDCSDALTGLKAVQREARKTTRSLRELEEQQKKMHYGVDLAREKDMTIISKYCTGCNRHDQYCVCSDENE